MKPWPKQHRLLAAVVALGLVGAASAYFLVVRPLAQDVDGARSSLESKTEELAKTGWDLDAEKLNSTREEQKKEKEKLEGQADEIQRHATSMFDEEVKEYATSPEQLANEVRQIDYQDEFDELEQWLWTEKIRLSEDVFGLAEDTASPHTYQQMLQLWTVERLVRLALGSKLKLTKHPTVKVVTEVGETPYASNLTVLPVRPYFLNPNDKKPYLLEFPVRMQLRGSIENVLAFLRSLHSDEVFCPITHLELRKVLPPRTSPDFDQVELTVECCSFFRFGAKPPKRREKSQTRPRDHRGA